MCEPVAPARYQHPDTIEQENEMTEQTPDLYDPTDHTVDDVRAYLDAADEAERARVFAAESDSKARTTILNYEPKSDADPSQSADSDEQPDPGSDEQPDDDEPDTTPPPAAPDAAPAHVRPKRYADGWAVGQPAPEQVVSLYDESSHTFGEPTPGDLQPGQRGHIVVIKGDNVSAGMLRRLRG